MIAVAIGNSKWKAIKSKLQSAQSRRDLNEKLNKRHEEKPKEWKSYFKKWKESQMTW